MTESKRKKRFGTLNSSNTIDSNTRNAKEKVNDGRAKWRNSRTKEEML